MSALSELLNAANQDPRLTTRQLQGRAASAGCDIHFGTIADYLRGKHPARPEEATLRALAEAFELNVEVIREAAGVPVGAGPYMPPLEAAQLTKRQQAAITELIMAIVEGGAGMATRLRRGDTGVVEVAQTFKDRDETATEPAGVSGSRSDDQGDKLAPNLGGGAVILGRVAAEDPNTGVQDSEHDTEDRDLPASE